MESLQCLIHIWKVCDLIRQFVAELDDCNSKGAKKICIIRKSNYEDVDKTLHLWFLQQQAIGTPISGTVLQTKAQIFYNRFHPGCEKFKASKGLLNQFKN